MNQELKGLYQQKQLLEAQMNAYHFSFPILEANRLLIRMDLSAERVTHFWNTTNEALNSQTRTHMALVAEYQTVLTRLAKINKAHSASRSLIPNTPDSEL